MAHRQEFYLYKRKKTRGSYWYVCYLDRESGKQGNAKSIDVLKERLGIFDNKTTTRRDDAVIIAKRALDSGIIYQDMGQMTFSDYAQDFWTFDKSDYIKMRNNLKPDSIGREYAANMLFFIRRHVIPAMPDRIKLQNITTKHLDNVISSLYDKGLSSGTIQLIAISFTQSLKEAERTGLILANPCKRMMKIVRSERVRGCLSSEEVSSLCQTLVNEKPRMYPSYYLGILLGICTGMRSGEIRALNINDLENTESGEWVRITIRHSLAPYTGLKGTKSKYDRAVLIPSELGDALRANADRHGILLPSKWGGYISSPTLRASFYELLEKIGIGEEERATRNLTFHSLRHTFSTLARDSSISQEDRMVVLGHRSREINDRYTHISTEALQHVSILTDDIFSQIKDAEKSAEKQCFSIRSAGYPSE